MGEDVLGASMNNIEMDDVCIPASIVQLGRRHCSHKVRNTDGKQSRCRVAKSKKRSVLDVLIEPVHPSAVKAYSILTRYSSLRGTWDFV